MKFKIISNHLRLLNLFFLAFCGLVLLNLTSVLAQNNAQTAAPKVSEAEAKLAKRLQDVTGLSEKMKVAEEFIKKYPQSSVRSQVARYIAIEIENSSDANQKLAQAERYSAMFNNPDEAALITAAKIDAYSQLNRSEDAFKAAESYLTQNPDDVRIRYMLVIQGSNAARSQNMAFVAPTREYARRAIELIETGKKPADLSDQTWKNAQTVWLPQLYQAMGFIEAAGGNRKEARAHFEKASTLAPREPNSWAMLAFMANEEYQETAKRYTVADAGAGKDELFQKAQQQLDQVIEHYARVVALTEGDAASQNINAQFRQDLENYYKYRHKSTAGLKELIEKYKNPK